MWVDLAGMACFPVGFPGNQIVKGKTGSQVQLIVTRKWPLAQGRITIQ